LSEARPSLNYPTSFSAISTWAQQNGVGVREARLRFAQYGVLRGIASSASLRELLVFKGGNALDFIWDPNRSTLDLDFSVDMSRLEGRGLPEAQLRALLSGGLNVSGRELGISFGVHSVRRQPPGEGKTFVTYTARIGYALPDDPRNRTLLEAGRSSLLVVPVDVSINEPIGADQSLVLGDSRSSLRVSTPEDIVAEKLRAFLQQKETVRNRERPQDLLDIAHLLQRNTPLNLSDVSRFLLRKAEARNVSVSKAAFRDPELAERAHYGYEELRDTVRGDFVPFDEALRSLHGLVEELDIPEE
jgi:predicted nucleotidyltransferase component of viral defense system